MTAKKKPEAKAEPKITPRKAAAKKPAAPKTPTTVSGTMSAADRKPDVDAPRKFTHPDAPIEDAADPADGPGLVEHGVGLGRHRPEDGPVPAPGTVILVTPERG